MQDNDAARAAGHQTIALRVTPRRLFVLLGLLAAVVIIAFRVQSLMSDRARLLEQRAAQATSLAQFAATYTSRLYDESSRLAGQVNDHLHAHQPTPRELSAYLAARAADTQANDYLVVLNREGRLMASSDPALQTGAIVARPNFESRMRGRERYVETVRRSRLTGAVVYALSQSLVDRGGAFDGVVGISARPEGIRPTAQRGPQEPMLTLWGHDGRFIGASFVDFDAEGEAIAPRKPPGLGIPGSGTSKDPRTVSAALNVEGWPLIAVASFDREGVLTPWRRDVYENIALIGLVLAGISLLVWFGVKTAEREEKAKRALEETSKIAAEAVKDRDLLLKEVHHRVKNSLLMTSSLIHLQARQFDDPEVREAFESTRRRLTSIGLVHEALYSGSSLEEVELDGYLGRLVQEIAEAYGADARAISIRSEIEPIMLAPSQVTPVGLIVTELITNAFKHAFGPGGGGEILLRARLINVDEIEITVRDDGKGWSGRGPEKSGSLGTRLIRSLAEQLGGVLSISNEDGAAFQIIFPRMTKRAPETSAPAS